ncbi:EAL domain-containing protein [Roseomonas sp. E05]|uniref:putative bifunctional diguanylate cyclase/phosphodiesterase n=1 Tax=Roseomonas sp. E05 TaxID=3046310 RepID=UPI0024B9A607|nr:EAL domain-containing protein [Roseomonas sp. E05]MDJ0391597.1 EAL domain-containing protein [Roseomonas sp. E05]
MSAATRDILLIGLGCLVVDAIASEENAFEALHALNQAHQYWQLDDLVTMAFVLPIGFAIYALRRQRELRREVTSRATAEAEAQRLALHDPLTGLPNRRQLREQGEVVLAQACQQETQVALMVIDLDRFKPVNDLHGHAAGDVVLREVALRLRDCVRDGDIVSRTGGDEFVLMAKMKAGAEDAARLARRIIATIGQPITLGEQTTRIGASVGIALARGQVAGQFGQLLHQADAALYRAKSEGRGTFNFHEAGMDAALRARAQVEADLRHAIAAGEIEPHFQPLIELATGRVEGFEALARWHHPMRGLIPPTDFIPIAEECGLIRPLTELILRQAAREAAGWPQPLFIAVNLSALLLYDLGLPELVLGILSETGLPPERLELEITETAVATNTDRVLQIAQTLKAHGVRLAMDDFGTGYSSLASLRALPFDRLKIDRSFVAALGEDAESEKIVATVVALGEALGMPAIAEGVEDAPTAQRLSAMGCQYGQGWLFGRPIPAKSIPPLLEAHKERQDAADCILAAPAMLIAAEN